MQLKLVKVWEYGVQCEFAQDDPKGAYRYFSVISHTDPQHGWNEVFNALISRGNFENMKRIAGTACYSKEYLLSDNIPAS